MKNLSQYLTETAQTYDYRIKIVGELPNGFMKSFKKCLDKYNPSSISDIKKTPVVSAPLDFPNFNNELVNIMDVVFNYPAAEDEIRQLAKLSGLNPDKIIINTAKYAASMDAEVAGIQDQNTDLLNSAYPDDNAEQKKASKDYGDGNQQVVKNNADEATWTVAGGKTPPAEYTSSLPMGDKSPLTDIKRPPLPATGNHPKG
jgi:hypothetical protein